MSRDILVRSAAALAVFGCLAYFAFGVAAVVASEQPGTAIHQYEPVTFALLWQETSKISPATVVAWSRRDENGYWLRLGLSIALTLALIALTFIVNPGILCSRHPAVIPGVGCVLGLLFLAGFFGLFHLLFTFLGAFVLGGLDGEWVNEAGPMYESVGLVYLIACLLFVRSLKMQEGRRDAAPLLR